MLKKSKVYEMPEALKHWLDGQLVGHKFDNYQALVDALDEKGFTISKSSIHRYAQKVRAEIEKNKNIAEIAQTLISETDDEMESKSLAAINLVWTAYLQALMQLPDVRNTDDVSAQIKLLGETSRAIAPLVRASLLIRSYQQGVRGDHDDDDAKPRLSADILKDIKERLYGIASETDNVPEGLLERLNQASDTAQSLLEERDDEHPLGSDD